MFMQHEVSSRGKTALFNIGPRIRISTFTNASANIAGPTPPKKNCREPQADSSNSRLGNAPADRHPAPSAAATRGETAVNG